MSHTSMHSAAVGSGGFGIGPVLNKSLTVYGKSFRKYVAFGAVIALPNLLSGLGHHHLREMVDSNARNTASSYALLGTLLFVLCQAAMIPGVFRDMSGRDWEIGASLRRSLTQALPVMGASLCAVLLVGLGLIL